MSEFTKLLIKFTADRDIRSPTWLAVVVAWINAELEGE